MVPWRALGMLAFGLAIIFMFVRLHGDGYDFPVKVANMKDELEFPRPPDRTYLEVSSLHPQDQDDDDKDAIGAGDKRPEPGTGAAVGSKEGLKFGVGWHSQWHLGKKKKVVEEEEPPSQKEEATTVVEKQLVDEQAKDEQEHGDERWIWMTNIWHSDGDCGSGHLRQYRRRLSDVMVADNATKWELMYTHKLPGPITHTSLSRRIIKKDGERTTESIRLAVVYKVIQDEHAAYHSRVYHFGVFQKQDLRDDCGPSTETCHRQHPFLSFDYVLPGTTLIKEFTLEHDTILYSRLSDTVQFRTLQLPKLKVGSTSPTRPFALSSGAMGPFISCPDKKLVPQRTSFLTKIPSKTKNNDLHILMAHVQEYRERGEWDYQVSVSTELTEAMTGLKKWLPQELQWISPRHPSITHETDMMMDEPYTYGTAVQNPFVVKAADGSSFHLPVKGTIMSLENNEKLWSRRKKNDPYLFRSMWGSSMIDGSLGAIITEQGVINDANDVMVLKTSGSSILVLKRDFLPEDEDRISTPWRLAMVMSDRYYDPTSPTAASRNVSSLSSSSSSSSQPQAVQATAFYRTCFTVLLQRFGHTVLSSPSSTSSLLLTSSSHPQVLAMRIVRARPTATIKAEEALEMMPKEDEDDKGDVSVVEEEESVVLDKERNVLLMVYGDGKMRGYDLERTVEESPVLMFLDEKYHVVIGMLAVVVAFVINEAR
ncbi:MAG: hypothetical protein BYD32DRAFT_410379 [Podila humilis]|nr:MAG: hypothetical protein BYD32DRAFT_410379 [Podila humilis]